MNSLFHSKKYECKKKVEIIQQWFVFRNVFDIMQFLDIVNFYRQFIKHFNKIVELLIVMLKKSQKFRKNSRKRNRNRNRNRNNSSNELNIFLIYTILKIFKRFRKTFIETSILRYFDFKRIIRIKIDAFDKIIEIILCQ